MVNHHRIAVHPEDVVNVSIAQQTGGTWQISLENKTTGQRYQTTVQYQSSLSSVEWIEEAPATATASQRIVTLDDFGRVQVQGGGAVAGGRQLTIAEAGGQPITMHGRDGQPVAEPSILGPDGASFTVTRLNGAGMLAAPQSGW